MSTFGGLGLTIDNFGGKASSEGMDVAGMPVAGE